MSNKKSRWHFDDRSQQSPNFEHPNHSVRTPKHLGKTLLTLTFFHALLELRKKFNSYCMYLSIYVCMTRGNHFFLNIFLSEIRRPRYYEPRPKYNQVIYSLFYRVLFLIFGRERGKKKQCRRVFVFFKVTFGVVHFFFIGGVVDREENSAVFSR